MNYSWQGVLMDGVILTCMLAIMLMPWWIAKRRRDPHRNSIMVISLLLGWTFIGWVIALAMAVRGKNWIAESGEQDLGIIARWKKKVAEHKPKSIEGA